MICDDGLQHWRLQRDIEIAVVDGQRRHGNGRCLPAGPLREFPCMQNWADLIVATGPAGRGEFSMTLEPSDLVSTVHGVCGIGNPERFFASLEKLNLHVQRHGFADHHGFVARDLHFGDDLPVVVTEKDAVKCRGFAGPNVWYLPVTASLPTSFATRIERLLAACAKAPDPAPAGHH